MSSSKILDVLFCRVVDLKDIIIYTFLNRPPNNKYTPELARFCDILMKPVNVVKNLSKTSSRDKGSGKMHCNKFEVTLAIYKYTINWVNIPNKL